MDTNKVAYNLSEVLEVIDHMLRQPTPFPQKTLFSREDLQWVRERLMEVQASVGDAESEPKVGLLFTSEEAARKYKRKHCDPTDIVEQRGEYWVIRTADRQFIVVP